LGIPTEDLHSIARILTGGYLRHRDHHQVSDAPMCPQQAWFLPEIPLLPVLFGSARKLAEVELRASEFRECRVRLRRMFAALLATLAGFAILASGAELRGTWSASTNGRYLAGTWTAETQPDGSATGRWALQDATGKILMQGGWSASKSAQSWNGAWRATVSGNAAEYAGTWNSAVSLSPEARLAAMFESALRGAVTGTWKAGAYSGSWSIRASP